uniref:Mitochondrial ribosomal protein L24 n=1 Tax=Rhizophora mucronata TaxID=61149 RepID=A0A2P2K502_RHIMU
MIYATCCTTLLIPYAEMSNTTHVPATSKTQSALNLKFLKGQAFPSQFLHHRSSPKQDPWEYPWDQLQ